MKKAFLIFTAAAGIVTAAGRAAEPAPCLYSESCEIITNTPGGLVVVDGRGHVWEARGLFPDRGRVTVVFDDATTPVFIPDDIVVAVAPALR